MVYATKYLSTCLIEFFLIYSELKTQLSWLDGFVTTTLHDFVFNFTHINVSATALTTWSETLLIKKNKINMVIDTLILTNTVVLIMLRKFCPNNYFWLSHFPFWKIKVFFFMLLGMSQIELLDSDLQGIFQRYDRDRSGKIDLFELRDALYGTGYAIPASVLQLLVSKYDDGSGRRVELNFDSFVE